MPSLVALMGYPFIDNIARYRLQIIMYVCHYFNGLSLRWSVRLNLTLRNAFSDLHYYTYMHCLIDQAVDYVGRRMPFYIKLLTERREDDTYTRA